MAYDGSIRIQTVIDNKGFRSGRKEIESGLSGIKTSLKSLASAIGAAFGAAAVVNFGRESVQAASDLSNALHGLQSIVEGQGRSFEKARAFIQDYISDGLVPMTNAVAAYKNLAARGYSDEQIQQVMLALKDSAAFGRQASYSLGEAVTSATEGLKNENSILVDNAGVTKNVAKMWDDYAKSIGTTTNNLTQEQKIQAEVNGILEETRFQTGDAAKVAQSYSGQVSQLTFNFNNLKVAAGNALIPIVQAVLPGLNKLLSSLTDILHMAGQVTAALFGTQAAKQEKLASTASKAAKQETALAKATKKASEAAKNAALSIDELNIAQSKENNGSLNDELSSDSLGNSLADSISAGADEIDKISPKAREIADKIRGALKTIKDALSEFAPLLSGITTGFATAFALKWVSGALSKMKKIGGASSLFLGLKKAITATALSFSLAGNPIKAMGAGLRVLGDSLTATQKAMIGLGGSIAVFTTVKDATKDLTMQNIDLGTSMANIIPVMGAVGVALYSMLGPWGLVAEAIVSVIAAIVGFNEAQQQLQDDILTEEFFNGVGTGIDEIADSFRNAWGEIEVSNGKVQELSETVAQNKTKIQELCQEIGAYEGVLRGGGTLTEEQVALMSEKYKELYEAARTNLDSEFQIVIAAYGKHLEAAAKESGLNVDAMLADLNRLNGDMNTELDDLEQRQSKLRSKLIDGTITEAERKEYNNITMLIADLSIGVSETQTRLNDIVSGIGEINFKDTDTAVSALKDINDTAKALLEESDQAKITALNAVDNIKTRLDAELEYGLIDQEEFNKRMKLCNGAAEAIETSYNEKEAEIKQSIRGIFDKVQMQIVTAMGDEEKALEDAWGNMTGIEKWLNGGSKDEYVRDGLRRYQTKIVAPITDKIKTSLENLEVDGSEWANEAMTGVIDAMFETWTTYSDFSGSDIAAKRIKPAETAIAEMLKKLGKDIRPEAELSGKNAMDGMTDGINANANKVGDAAKDAAIAAQEAVKQADDSHSPSREYEKLGAYDMQGYRDGIRKNASAVSTEARSAAKSASRAFADSIEISAGVRAFDSLFNAILSKTDDFCTRFRGAINDALEGMRTAVNSVTISSGGKISYAKMPPVKIPRLATGAVIPPNAQFAAILGDQTHGRNLEAPESLIRQIVREESGGSMDELLDRVEELIGAVRGIEFSPVMVAEGRVMAEAVSRANRANGYQIVR